jgi:hypothetical protein
MIFCNLRNSFRHAAWQLKRRGFESHAARQSTKAQHPCFSLRYKHLPGFLIAYNFQYTLQTFTIYH